MYSCVTARASLNKLEKGPVTTFIVTVRKIWKSRAWCESMVTNESLVKSQAHPCKRHLKEKSCHDFHRDSAEDLEVV